MTAYEIIAKKRDGIELKKREIRFFIEEFLKGKIKDYQLSALLMAIYCRGMSDDEIFALTESYIQSGARIDLSGIPGIKVDKHSTGGVGDKVSIILAPLAASLGVPVPMISGRGLGHTGGTLDKLESIPGFRVFGSADSFKKQLAEIGVAMLGQTDSIVPADRKIYALRDVTATVESIPLITASIMSKKIAEGIDALVLDVKYGNGAFMKEIDQARLLAQYLIKVGAAFGKKVVAYLTSMEQPLGKNVGNWLEVAECIDCFHGNGPADLMEVTLTLTAEMLVLAGKAGDHEEALRKCRDALVNGTAFEKFLEMVRYQGGDTGVIESPQTYPLATYRQVVPSPAAGFVQSFNTQAVGLAAVQLGSGRLRAEDAVDPRAGIVVHKKIGDFVEKGEPLFVMHTNNEKVLEPVAGKLLSVIKIGEKKSRVPKLIAERMNRQ